MASSNSVFRCTLHASYSVAAATLETLNATACASITSLINLKNGIRGSRRAVAPPERNLLQLFLARGDLGYGQIGKVWAKLVVAAPVALPHEPGVRPPFQLTGRFGGRDFLLGGVRRTTLLE